MSFDPDNRPYKIVCPVCKGDCLRGDFKIEHITSNKYTLPKDRDWSNSVKFVSKKEILDKYGEKE